MEVWKYGSMEVWKYGSKKDFKFLKIYITNKLLIYLASREN
jgi:hypothetical protein